MAKVKKNKNTNTNTVNKNNPNQKSQSKQVKLKPSEYCEKSCKDVEVCEKYKNYILRMVNGAIGRGLMCGK
jgi:hypothetical protein